MQLIRTHDAENSAHSTTTGTVRNSTASRGKCVFAIGRSMPGKMSWPSACFAYSKPASPRSLRGFPGQRYPTDRLTCSAHPGPRMTRAMTRLAACSTMEKTLRARCACSTRHLGKGGVPPPVASPLLWCGAGRRPVACFATRRSTGLSRLGTSFQSYGPKAGAYESQILTVVHPALRDRRCSTHYP